MALTAARRSPILTAIFEEYADATVERRSLSTGNLLKMKGISPNGLKKFIRTVQNEVCHALFVL